MDGVGEEAFFFLMQTSPQRTRSGTSFCQQPLPEVEAYVAFAVKCSHYRSFYTRFVGRTRDGATFPLLISPAIAKVGCKFMDQFSKIKSLHLSS